MNPRINYTLVGAFVVLLVLAALALAGWMSHERRSSERLPYITYFYDSVTGLNERAQVRYRGVPVGYVEAITLVSDPEERVKLRLLLDADAPLRTDTYATLQHQGVTGLLSVELQSSNSRGTRLLSSWEQPAEIPSRSSRLVQFTDSIDELTQQLTSLLNSVTQVSDQLASFTNTEMREQLFTLLHTSQTLAATAERRLQEVNPQVYQQLALTLDALAAEMTQQTQALPAHLKQLENSLEQQLSLFQQQLQRLGDDTSSSARQLTPLLQQTEQLLEQLHRESNSWLRSNQTQPKGPGE